METGFNRSKLPVFADGGKGTTGKRWVFYQGEESRVEGSLHWKTDASTSEEVSVIFLILKVPVGISESLAQGPSAADEKDAVPVVPITILASTVYMQITVEFA